MRPTRVEEVAVLVEHLLQVRLVVHEYMVDTFAPDGADESLHVAVGLGRQDRRAHDARARALGDGVEVAPELGVVVTQEKLRTPTEWRQLPKLLVTARRTLRDSRCMTTKTKWQRNHRSRTSKRSQHQIPAAWLRRNVDQRCPGGVEGKRLM
jgi:hypothetical protein